jgi:general secretion pathway protein D
LRLLKSLLMSSAALVIVFAAVMRPLSALGQTNADAAPPAQQGVTQGQPPTVVKAQQPVVAVVPPLPTPAPAQTEPATIDFEFQGAPITAILEWYARLTKRSIISAPNLAGIINFRSQTKLTQEEAIQALDSVLAINNVAAIPLGDKFLKIVPIPTAKQEGIPFGQVRPPADTLGTQIIPLKYAETADIITALQPYMHAYGQLMALTKSNSILITETAGNLKQMLEIVAYVDQPSALRMEMRSYFLSHAKAADVMQRLQSMIQEAQQAGARPAAAQPGQPAVPGQPVRRVLPQPGQGATATGGEETAVEGKVIMTADERTNKIFILTRVSNFDFFDQIIAELDAKVDPDVMMKVIDLDYANAEDIASLLNSLITGSAPTAVRRTTNTGTTTSGARPPAIPPPPTAVSSAAGSALEASGFLQFAQGVRIIPDIRVNSLLVMATKEDLARIENLIKSVDTPVAQVLIEVVIAEVQLDGTLDVGVEAFKRQFEAGNVSQTGGTRTGQPSSPLDLSPSGLAAIATNISPLALSSGLTYFATFNGLKLDAVIHLLATSSRFKVLSTPIIQTLHNQEAHIIVGESRPIVTSTVADVVASGNTAVNSSVSYKDIAIELTVTPRINPDGNVTMDIEQKVNDLGGTVSVNGIDTPIITKREAKSMVMVKDQSTIVLGGLIRENKTITDTKVPILGDIPLLGTAFKGKSTTKTRTELIVFIRPTVLRGDAQAMAEAKRRSQMLKASEELELDKKFPPALSAPEKKSPQPVTPAAMQPAPKKTQVETEKKTAATTPADRQSAKIKALKMQDGDTTTQ